jgi:hypothetical protein
MNPHVFTDKDPDAALACVLLAQKPHARSHTWPLWSHGQTRFLHDEVTHVPCGTAHIKQVWLMIAPTPA